MPPVDESCPDNTGKAYPPACLTSRWPGTGKHRALSLMLDGRGFPGYSDSWNKIHEIDRIQDGVTEPVPTARRLRTRISCIGGPSPRAQTHLERTDGPARPSRPY